jgi:hypothetical protein
MSFIYDVTLLLTFEVIKQIWKKSNSQFKPHVNQNTRLAKT